MAFVIEDEKVIRDIERLAHHRGIHPAEVVAGLVEEKALLLSRPDRKLSYDDFHKAVCEIQDLYARNHDPNDHRTAEEIIGYNEQGLFD